MASTPDVWRNRIVGEADVDPATLTAHPLNWRQHSDRQAEALTGVLREVGWVQRVIVNERTGHLLDGHLRVALALDAKAATVPVLYVDLSEAQEQLVLATLDPISALADADAGLLKALLEDVQSGEAGVQALLSALAVEHGIVPPEGTGTPVQDPEPQVDRLDELMARWQVQPGDLWQLGDHRILCADCLDPAMVTRLLGATSPAMIFADPPYGVSIVATNGFVGGVEAYDIPFGGVKNRRGTVGAAKPFGSQAQRGSDGASHVVEVGKYAPIIGDETTATALTASAMLLEAYPTAVHVWWGGNYYADGLPPSSCWLVWNKETTGNFADCELAWTNQPKAARLFTHRWNGMLRDSEHERRWHPTQKPAALAAWVYDTLGHHGDVVFDPFLGSGPSIIAGEQRGRTVSGMELSVEYVAITLQRWADLTGRQPERSA